MSDPQADENQEGGAASSSVADQTNVANPPTGESPEANRSENMIPQSRLNEVIAERNALRERIAQEEESRSRQNVADQTKSQIENEVQHLVKTLKLDESAARELVASQNRIAQAARQQDAEQMTNMKIQSWMGQVAAKNPDFSSLKEDMDREYSKLSPAAKQLVISSPEGIEMHYLRTKALKGPSTATNQFNAGAEKAYANKQVKEALASGSGKGSVAPGKLTRASIAAMSPAEYVKNQSAINAALANGSLS